MWVKTVWAIGTLLASCSVMAQFSVCNNTNGDVRVSAMYMNGGMWKTSAHKFVARGECSAVVAESLEFRYVHFYAKALSPSGKEWKGNGRASVCVPRDDQTEVTFRAVVDCHDRGPADMLKLVPISVVVGVNTKFAVSISSEASGYQVTTVQTGGSASNTSSAGGVSNAVRSGRGNAPA